MKTAEALCAKGHYVVVSPAELYHPHTGTVSVHLGDLNETVRVSVRLERGDGRSAITLLEREVREPRLHENVRFQVPAPSGGQQEVAELHVSIRGDALQFSERKKVLLRALQPGTFVQTDKAVYKPGQTVKFRIVSLDKDFVPSTQKMLLKAAGGSALKNEKLQLFVSYGDVKQDQTFLTDESGRASFELDTSGWTGRVTLRGHFKQVDGSSVFGRVSPSYPDAHRNLEPFYSKSQSFLKIRWLGGVLPCDQAQQLQVDYIIAREALGNGSRSLEFIFLVVAKGAIARILHKGLDLREGAGLKGSFSVELPVGADLAPAAKVLGYTVLPDGEMAADRARLQLAKCLPNKVKLAFSQDRALPGSELQLRVQAAPGSLCAVRAVDQSVLLMKPKAELSVDTVYNLLPRFPQGDYPAAAREPESGDCPYFSEYPDYVDPWQWRHRRPQSVQFSDSDSYRLFKDAALKILTNANTKKPFICPDIPIFRYSSQSHLKVGLPGSPGGLGGTGIRLMFVWNLTFNLAALGDCQEDETPDSIALRIMETLMPLHHIQVTILWDGDMNLEDASSEEISLQLPANVLAGSERAHVTVLGDIMGTALQNIDRLLAMPYGCGEQNMVRFAPNIYIQQYLEKSGQLSPEIRDKAKGFLQSGYQRELLYKHNDGSYSAFGERDATGNTWLTAFVLKSFGQARPYISIDEKHLEDALRWLQRHQLESGCFRSVGKLFHNTLQGGVVDELSLSAYITAALLELGQPLTRKVKALPSPYGNQAPSAEVEMTAYVLLAYLSLPNVSAADMATAAQIVRWLSKQQNPYGGFASTQDTVVALQALAKYAALTYSASGAVSVTVSSQAGARQRFHVDNANRLVLQRAALQEIPGQYTVRASGKGCVFVQLILRYNVPPPRSAATFDLRVETEPKECTESATSRFSLMLHARYSGKRHATNMAIIEAKLPSGYIPVQSSLRQLEKQPLVKRLEVQNDQVTLYLDQLTKEAASFTFSLEQDFPVKNLRAAPVRLYDYYETGEHTEAEYSAPCGSGSCDAPTHNSSPYSFMGGGVHGPERHYVVVSPAELYHPHTGTVSVHLGDLNETVRVSVRLERGDGPSAITLLEREVREPRLHENVRFQVPAPSGGQQEVAELHVSIRGDALQFSERKKVLLRALEPGTFVQTDKAVYKPGQTVKFRIVSLDKDFVPSTRKDPSGNRIAQWRDVTPQQGIVDLSLPLSAEPALGTYAIAVQGTRHSFSVEEYVLPKFEVTLELPPVVTVLDETLLLRVCGRYTYGKPVLGRVQASLCREEIPEDPWYGAQCMELTGQMLLKAAGGSALKNEKLQLFVSSGDENKNQTFLTDESGRASFELDTSGWTGWVTLRGHFKQVNDSAEHDRVSPSYPDANRFLQPFYSESQSFLKIRWLGEGLPCDQAQQLQVDYIIAREALGNGSRSLEFIFL
ncbi:hypothetical protein KIL84_002433, partial [Mauremys mutica]